MLRQHTNWQMKITTITAIIILSLTLTGLKVEAAGSARDFLKAGAKAVTDKNYDLAIKHLTEAISSGNLSAREVARALYNRGLAYNAKSEPARGIADFTRALFFKKITPEQRSKILSARAQSYKAVGLSSRASADLRVAGLRKSTNTNITLPEKPKLRPVEPQQQLQLNAPQPRKVKQAVPQNNSRNIVESGWGASVQQDTSAGQSNKQNNYLIRSSKKKTTTPAKTEEKSRSPFASLFNSSQSKNQPRKQPQPQPKQQKTTSSGWNSEANVRTASISNNASSAPLKQVNYTSTGSGRYRLQLAAVSTENDAQQAWLRLQSQHSGLLSNQRPDFQKVDLGSGRSVVRIQIGPFADKLKTLQLCNSFKQQGLECFLVVR